MEAMSSVELETGRPRGREGVSGAPEVMLAKMGAKLEEQHKLADQVRAAICMGGPAAVRCMGGPPAASCTSTGGRQGCCVGGAAVSCMGGRQ